METAIKSMDEIARNNILYATSAPSYIQKNNFFHSPNSFLLKGDFVFFESSGCLFHHNKPIINHTLDNILHPMHKVSYDKMVKSSFDASYIELNIHNPVLLTSSWSTNNCYHFFVDVIGKLALMRKFHNLSNFIFLIPSWGKFYKEFFDFMGLNYFEYDKKINYSVKNLLVPSLPGISNRINLDTLTFLREVTRDLIYTKKSYFINRKTRGILNQEELIGLISNFTDLESVFLEDFPLIEQIRMMVNSDLVIGAHGAGFAFSAFKKGGSIAEIFSDKFTNPPYKHMHQQSGLRYRAYFTNPSTGFRFGENHFDNFQVDLSRFKNFLSLELFSSDT